MDSNLNELLRKNKMELQPIEEFKANPLIKNYYTPIYKENSEYFLSYALNNIEKICSLEYKYNNGQPPQITRKHLLTAKLYIENNRTKFSGVENITYLITDIIIKSNVSLTDVLLSFHLFLQIDQKNLLSDVCIVYDEPRKYIYDIIFEMDVSLSIAPNIFLNQIDKFDQNIQIVLESSDWSSAIDALIMDVSDRCDSLWHINSVFIQESVIDEDQLEKIIKRRLAAIRINNIESSLNELNNEYARFGAKLIVNERNIRIYIGVPPKHLPQSKPNEMRLITINFFRTSKELIDLLKMEKKLKTASVWTENIGGFYEVATALTANIVWCNSIGVFSPKVPSLQTIFDKYYYSDQKSFSSIDEDDKLAVHCQKMQNEWKYLIIPFGKTFAN